MLSFEEFTGNVWQAVHQAGLRNTNLVRSYFAAQGDLIDALYIDRFDSPHVFVGQPEYLTLAEGALVEFLGSNRSSSFLGSSFKLKGTWQEQGEKSFFDIVVTIDLNGKSMYGAVLRKSGFDAGYITPEETEDFVKREGRLLHQYIKATPPDLRIFDWPHVGIMPIDRRVAYLLC